MTVRRPRRVEIEARAKLNLGLAVGGLRVDGFHELATVYQSISLADTLVARRRPRGFTLAVRHAPAAERGAVPPATRRLVPGGRANLVLRAARLVAARDPRIGGAAFTLIKRIPARAGLGGGSADAAAALAALDALWGVRRARAARVALAAELGSDVPFAVFGGTARGLGRGERLERLRLVTPFRAVVAVPRWRISTARAFERLDRARFALTHWDANLRIANRLRPKAVTLQDAMRLGNAFEDVLGERRQDFVSLRDRLRAAGVESVRMTGSGSAVFGVIPPGTSGRDVLGRFAGDETLYGVRSRGTGLRLRVRA